MATESNQNEDSFRTMLTTKSPEALERLYDASAGGFNPAIKLPAVHPLRQLFAKRMKKKLKGQDTRAIELYVEQPKTAHNSPFLRAITGPAADAVVETGAHAPPDARGGGVRAQPEGVLGGGCLRHFFERRAARRGGGAGPGLGKQQAAGGTGLKRSKRAKEARGGVEVAGKSSKAVGSGVGAVKATAAAGRGMMSGGGVTAGGAGSSARSKKAKGKSAVKRAARVAAQ